jgi:hypothetical protein
VATALVGSLIGGLFFALNRARDQSSTERAIAPTEQRELIPQQVPKPDRTPEPAAKSALIPEPEPKPDPPPEPKPELKPEPDAKKPRVEEEEPHVRPGKHLVPPNTDVQYLSDMAEFDVKVAEGRFAKKGNLGYSAGGSDRIVVNGKESPNGLSMHALSTRLPVPSTSWGRQHKHSSPP